MIAKVAGNSGWTSFTQLGLRRFSCRRGPVTWYGVSRLQANKVEPAYFKMAAFVVGSYALVKQILSCDDDDDDLVVLLGIAGM